MACSHNQIWVKVNAPVDEGVAELVEMLNTFPGLRTMESCQGDDQSPAWVYFAYADDRWQELAEFTLGHLGPYLSQELGDQVRVSICVTSAGEPQGELLVRPGALHTTVEALRSLSAASQAAAAPGHAAEPGHAAPAAPAAPLPSSAMSTVEFSDPPISTP